MSLNQFPVTDLRLEVKLIQLAYCACADTIVMFETHGIRQTQCSLERYLG